MQHSVRAGDYDLFKRFTAMVNDQTGRLKNLRGLFELIPAAEPIPLEEVEPASEIVQRQAARIVQDHRLESTSIECLDDVYPFRRRAGHAMHEYNRNSTLAKFVQQEHSAAGFFGKVAGFPQAQVGIGA